MAEAAKKGIPTCMELGGKSCLIVFDDANVDDAVEWAMVRSLLLAAFEGTLHNNLRMSFRRPSEHGAT